MTESNSQTPDWNAFVEQWNEQFLDALETNVEAQAEFVEQWSETLDDAVEDEDLAEGVEGYARAYDAWMDASKQMADRMHDVVEGEDVDLEEFRDIWLNTANEAFKDVMSTSTFAKMTGETVGDVLELQAEANETAETTLRTIGFATSADVVEVGDRLVELERRQHAVERKLDRVIDMLGDGDVDTGSSATSDSTSESD